MTDITKQALSPPRSFLSQDAIQVFYRLLAALLICAALAVFSESFLSLGNILNVLRQASLTFFIASGLTLVVLTAGLDLSVGANVALSACIAGTVIHQTGSPLLGILTGLLVGGVVGLLNGVMVTALRIPSFIATYGMLWVLNGLTYWYMAGDTIHGFPAGFRQIGSGYLFGLPIPVYLLLIFLAGARKSMRSAPIRSRRGFPAFRSHAGCCSSTPSPAPWRGWPRSSSCRGSIRRKPISARA
jgi:ribose transport system permease protein